MFPVEAEALQQVEELVYDRKYKRSIDIGRRHGTGAFLHHRLYRLVRNFRHDVRCILTGAVTLSHGNAVRPTDQAIRQSPFALGDCCSSVGGRGFLFL